MTERYDTLNEAHTVLRLYYRAVTGRFYTAEEKERFLALLLRTVALPSGTETEALSRLVQEYDPDELCRVDVHNLHLMFLYAEKTSAAEEIIVDTMLDVLDAQERDGRTYLTRVEWLRALRRERADTAEALFERACLAYVTTGGEDTDVPLGERLDEGNGEIAAALFARAASKSDDTDLWRLAATTLAAREEHREEAYAALCRYAIWNRLAALDIPAAVQAQLEDLEAALGKDITAGLRDRIEAEINRDEPSRIGF